MSGDGATTGDGLAAETLAAMEAAAVDIAERGVQSVADALLMADVIVDNPDGDVEWLIAHGCDVADHLRREVRRLTAALDGVRREERREPPTRDEVRRHHVEHGGYWLVSSVRVGHPTREDCRPMVLQVIDGEYGPHAGTPHAGYGGAWDDPWALMTGAEWQRIDRDGRLMADEGSDGR